VVRHIMWLAVAAYGLASGCEVCPEEVDALPEGTFEVAKWEPPGIDGGTLQASPTRITIEYVRSDGSKWRVTYSIRTVGREAGWK